MDDALLKTSLARGHESAETDLRPVWLSGLGLVVLIIATIAIVAGMMRFFAAESGVGLGPAKGRAAEELPAGTPALDVNQSAELKRLLEQQREMLTQLQWVDRSTGIARIPIDEAISIIAERGLPTSFGGQSAEESHSHE